MRELSHVIERAVILAESKQLEFSTLLNVSSPEKNAQEITQTVISDQTEFQEQVDFNLLIVEELTIQKALHHYAGNITKAAKALGLTRGALYRRLEKYNL